jgi:hypothetical protein
MIDVLESTVRAEISKSFSAIGVKYWATSDRRAAHGTRGLPDMLVSMGHGLMLALEVKRPNGGRLSDEQSEQEERWQVVTVRSAEEAILAWQAARRMLK